MFEEILTTKFTRIPISPTPSCVRRDIFEKHYGLPLRDRHVEQSSSRGDFEKKKKNRRVQKPSHPQYDPCN